MITVEQLQDVLKTKSTTFVRKNFDVYCKTLQYPKYKYKDKQENWYYSNFDCKRRLRTICRLFDGEHDLNVSLRKKAGYYFLIEYDRHRIFECTPNIIVLKQEILDVVLDKYKEFFEKIVS